MSPNIPLTSPISSSMNVSGLNIDVGNATAQALSTSVTSIPPNPINTQMHVSEGPRSTPETSSKANPQFKFPLYFLLNPGQHSVGSQEPFGQGKQPSLNVPFGSQSHVGHEKRVDGGKRKRPLENFTWIFLSEGNSGLKLHQNMAPKGKTVRSQEPIEGCDELYASLPLVHKEKVSRHHHPYASKPETNHASSSREKIIDDEDDNISLTQSGTNDEPRRENFMAHEEGTQSNSESTHPQMPLAHIATIYNHPNIPANPSSNTSHIASWNTNNSPTAPTPNQLVSIHNPNPSYGPTTLPLSQSLTLIPLVVIMAVPSLELALTLLVCQPLLFFLRSVFTNYQHVTFIIGPSPTSTSAFFNKINQEAHLQHHFNHQQHLHKHHSSQHQQQPQHQPQSQLQLQLQLQSKQISSGAHNLV
ncbi:hypothetical protein O181_010022 [Austropuccinia psidii MF-1]|uniref:Uncharacterized protein n=1 Tax=Austropuccinia psidii MF-1 TaxID=1389203 RepID=A0A9Q3GKT8_9BASI|nr:hypothetical protein [Austropuccinia psidii MF-1]